MLCPSSSSPARVARISLARQPLQSPLCQPRRQPSGPPARTNLETTRRASGKASSSMASSDGASQLKAKDITAENFAPFGQVIAPTDDGKHFDESDAQLVLSGGVPRFYIMRLPRRGLSFKTIVHHAIVTQCLGSTQAEPWYMAVAAKDVETPSADNMHAFRIPPGVYIKLHCGTWHAGPLFDSADHLDFANLELSDTNVTDFNCFDFLGTPTEEYHILP
mmetsp:Transcript_6067/g.14986  ORF Transcript_6067/g.14986 Transcript_6067/m.14986 type:complete len:220 (-) Transcript_6067:136-795(-)